MLIRVREPLGKKWRFPSHICCNFFKWRFPSHICCNYFKWRFPSHICCNFFKWRFPSHICCNFFKCRFPSRISCNFFKTTLILEKLLFQHKSSCFFWETPFSEHSLICSSYFFKIAAFFNRKLLPSIHFLRIGSSLRQLLVGTATFLAEDLFRIKITTKHVYRYFCAGSTFSCVSVIAQSRITDKVYLISWLATQSTVELLLFDEAIFWISYFFRGFTF